MKDYTPRESNEDDDRRRLRRLRMKTKTYEYSCSRIDCSCFSVRLLFDCYCNWIDYDYCENDFRLLCFSSLSLPPHKPVVFLLIASRKCTQGEIKGAVGYVSDARLPVKYLHRRYMANHHVVTCACLCIFLSDP